MTVSTQPTGFWFTIMIGTLAFVVIYTLWIFIRYLFLTDEELAKRSQSHELSEMKEFYADRAYEEETGKHLLPQAY